MIFQSDRLYGAGRSTVLICRKSTSSNSCSLLKCCFLLLRSYPVTSTAFSNPFFITGSSPERMSHRASAHATLSIRSFLWVTRFPFWNSSCGSSTVLHRASYFCKGFHVKPVGFFKEVNSVSGKGTLCLEWKGRFGWISPNCLHVCTTVCSYFELSNVKIEIDATAWAPCIFNIFPLNTYWRTLESPYSFLSINKYQLGL